MIKEYELCSCGLSCDICDANTTKFQDAIKYLLNTFKDPSFLEVLSFTAPNFKRENFNIFKEALDALKNHPPCPGCKERMDCAINQCVKKRNIDSCSKCDMLDLEREKCLAQPEPMDNPHIPPPSMFLNGLIKRYQKWNFNNLKAMKLGNLAEVKKTISQMIKDGKSSRDLIDTSINLFEQVNELK